MFVALCLVSVIASALAIPAIPLESVGGQSTTHHKQDVSYSDKDHFWPLLAISHTNTQYMNLWNFRTTATTTSDTTLSDHQVLQTSAKSLVMDTATKLDLTD